MIKVRNLLERKLTEGLIKIPPRVKKEAYDFAWKSILGKIYGAVMYSGSDFPREQEKFGKLFSKYNIKKTFSEPQDVLQVDYDSKYLPKHYPKSKSSKLFVAVVFDHNSIEHEKLRNAVKGSRGIYVDSLALVSINVSMYGFDYWMLNENSYKMFMNMMKQIEGTIDHELMHTVQDKILKHVDPKQVQYKNDTKDNYFNSQAEFDPQIRSAIDEVKETILKIRGKYTDKNFNKNMVRLFVGEDYEEGSGLGDSIKLTPSNFFLSLRAKNNKQWKKAINKFVIELKKDGVKL